MKLASEKEVERSSLFLAFQEKNIVDVEMDIGVHGENKNNDMGIDNAQYDNDHATQDCIRI